MAEPKSDGKSDSIGEIVKTIVYALLIALAFRIFLFQPFSIPSSSMKSTLLIGDYLFVSKYAYGYSQHSVPFSLIPFEGRIFAKEPKRGDVIVFRNSKDNNRDYIKRLVGLPGDVIQIQNGVLKVNGEFVKMTPTDDFLEEWVGPYRGQACLRDGMEDGKRVCVKESFVETTPDGASYTVLNADQNRSTRDNTTERVVTAGHYFFMGDNRDNSGDSRSSKVDLVPFDQLIGRAELIFLSSESNPFAIWNWRWSRFLKIID